MAGWGMRVAAGSIMGAVAAASAHAAELPAGKSAPRPGAFLATCPDVGPGYWKLPGTDTCVAYGAQIEVDTQLKQPHNRSTDVTTMTSIAHVALDAVTPTDYGPLRAFMRLEFTRATGDTTATPDVEYAFISWAGGEAGRTDSILNFYASSLNVLTLRGPDLTVNLVKYARKQDKGWSFMGALELDPTQLRASRLDPAFRAQGTPVPPTFATVTDASPTAVATAQYNADWGQAQVSAAAGHVRFQIPGASMPRFAALAGVQLNMPKPLDNDQLWLQAVATSGANSYLGLSPNIVSGSLAVAVPDGAVTPGGDGRPTRGAAFTAAYSHQISGTWTANLFGSYMGVDLPRTGTLLPAATGLRETRLGGNVVYNPLKNLKITAEAMWVDLNVTWATPLAAAGAGSRSGNGVLGVLQILKTF
ncbi:porin [Alsobacter sp. R-9]